MTLVSALVLALLATPMQSGPLSMISGIHHITAITRKVQANVDFYAGFLGMRLVKQTAGFEDETQLHLFYGDGEGTPGSLLTFLAWEDGSQGRAGFGQISEIALAIDPTSIGYWLTRAMSFGIRMEGPADDQPKFVDVDRLAIEIIGTERDRFKRALPSAMARGDDHLRVRLQRQYFGQGRKSLGGPVRVGRQAEIQRHNCRFVLPDEFDRGGAVARANHAITFISPFQLPLQPFIIFDDQQDRKIVRSG